MNVLLAAQLLAQLLQQAAALAPVIEQAKAEGRDITQAELDAVFAVDAAAATKLQADINAAAVAADTKTADMLANMTAAAAARRDGNSPD